MAFLWFAVGPYQNGELGVTLRSDCSGGIRIIIVGLPSLGHCKGRHQRECRCSDDVSGGFQLSHHFGTCWLEQWKLPPPAMMPRAGTPTARRSGKSAASASTAAWSPATP